MDSLGGLSSLQSGSGGGVAGATGLEPAASAVTGQRSNQLSYAPAGVGPDLKAAPIQVKADTKRGPAASPHSGTGAQPMRCRR